MPPAARDSLLAALTGALLTLAWTATGSLTPLVFIGFVPLLWLLRAACEGPSAERPARALLWRVYLGMFIWNAATTYWLGLVQESWSTRLLSGGFPMTANAALMVIPWWIARWAWRTFGATAGRTALVVAWLGFEHLHYDWDLQWPWLSVGNVFAMRTGWVQWYEWTGVAGGTLWVWVVNLFAERAVRSVRAQGGRAALPWVLAIGALLALPLLFSQRILHQRDARTAGRGVEVVLVQPNIDPYTEKFGGTDPLEQLRVMLDLAADAATDTMALVVIPETALQESTYLDRRNGPTELFGLWENDMTRSASYRAIRRFQAAHPADVIAGMSSALYYPPGTPASATARPLEDGGGAYDFFNAAMHVQADGDWASYHKSKLVVGVELMPFQWLLAPLGGISIDLGGTSGTLGHGPDRPVFTTDDGRVRAVPAICYESVFGDHIADHVRRGANLLVVITNDGWWGTSPGYRQHLALGRLRAIETRRPIARAANTGISCFVDAEGRITQATGWWQRTALRGTIHPSDEQTFFLRHGDLLGRCCAWLGVLLLFARVFFPFIRRSAKPTPG